MTRRRTATAMTMGMAVAAASKACDTEPWHKQYFPGLNAGVSRGGFNEMSAHLDNDTRSDIYNDFDYNDFDGDHSNNDGYGGEEYGESFCPGDGEGFGFTGLYGDGYYDGDGYGGDDYGDSYSDGSGYGHYYRYRNGDGFGQGYGYAFNDGHGLGPDLGRSDI